MKEGYVIRDQSLPHFLTATIVDWVDVFSRKNYRDVVIDCFDFCIKNKGMILYSYVIMSNHIHMIIQSNDGKLSDLIRDFKKPRCAKSPDFELLLNNKFFKFLFFQNFIEYTST